MIHSEPELLIISEYLRQMGATYILGKRKIDEWKKQYIQHCKELKSIVDRKSKEYRLKYQNKVRILKEIEDFYDSEEFFFGDENNIDEFFERYYLNLLDWDADYFKRKVESGSILIKGRNKKDANYKREKQDERLLDGDYRSGGMSGGSDERGSFRTGSGNYSSSVCKAAAYAGCVC